MGKYLNKSIYLQSVGKAWITPDPQEFTKLGITVIMPLLHLERLISKKKDKEEEEEAKKEEGWPYKSQSYKLHF